MLLVRERHEQSGFRFDEGHLDLSLSRTDGWPNVGPFANLEMSVGDPYAGPSIQFSGSKEPIAEDLWLPRHYHGTDQFHVQVLGNHLLSDHRLRPGDFAFQDAGRLYREGPGASLDGWWYLLISGRWRGGRSVFTGTERSAVSLDNITEDRIDYWCEANDPWWDDVPGGSKGIPGITTTLGEPTRGYLWGSFSDVEAWHSSGRGNHTFTGILGDPVCGPALLLTKRGPGAVVLPALTASTEVALFIVHGSCTVDASTYFSGDLRVQEENRALSDVRAGPDGVDVVVMIADRRALATMLIDDPSMGQWLQDTRAMVDQLVSTVAHQQPQRPPTSPSRGRL